MAYEFNPLSSNLDSVGGETQYVYNPFTGQMDIATVGAGVTKVEYIKLGTAKVTVTWKVTKDGNTTTDTTFTVGDTVKVNVSATCEGNGWTLTSLTLKNGSTPIKTETSPKEGQSYNLGDVTLTSTSTLTVTLNVSFSDGSKDSKSASKTLTFGKEWYYGIVQSSPESKIPDKPTLEWVKKNLTTGTVLQQDNVAVSKFTVDYSKYRGLEYNEFAKLVLAFPTGWTNAKRFVEYDFTGGKQEMKCTLTQDGDYDIFVHEGARSLGSHDYQIFKTNQFK